MRVLVVVVLMSGCVARPAAIDPIKIGVLNPISGALQSLGPSWENAGRLAEEDVNAGGGLFDGRPLELVFADSATDPDTAVAAGKDLVKQGVVGLVGPSTSGESTRVRDEVAAPHEIPMISCCATAADLTAAQAANTGFFFRTTPSDTLQGKALAFIANNGFSGGGVDAAACTRAAFVFRNDDYGTGFQTEFENNYVLAGEDAAVKIPVVVGYGSTGHEATGDELAAAADDVAAQVDALLVDSASNPEMCIVVISFDVDGAPVMAQIDKDLQRDIQNHAGNGFTFTYHFLTGDGANSGVFATQIGQSDQSGLSSRIIGTVPYHATSVAYDQFKKAVDVRYDQTGDPIAFSSQTYDAVFIMSLAITKAKSAVGKDIRNKLFAVSGADGGKRFEGAFFGEVAAAILAGDDVDYVGPSGELTFSPLGDVIGDYVVWQVADDGTGAYGVVERAPLLAETFNL